MIRRQVAQVHRPDDGCRVADRLNVDVEGGDDCPQLVCQIGTALAGEVLGPDDVDRPAPSTPSSTGSARAPTVMVVATTPIPRPGIFRCSGLLGTLMTPDQIARALELSATLLDRIN